MEDALIEGAAVVGELLLTGAFGSKEKEKKTMSKCPKCNNATVIQVTTQNKSNTTRERRGLVVAIVTFPFRLLKWMFGWLFIGREETYHKETFWRCNFCGEKFDEPVQ